MTTFLQDLMQKNAKKFYCKFCDFGTSNKYNFDKHLLTAKHKNTTKYNAKAVFLQENARPCSVYICDCGKEYPYRASLHNHKKKCKYINNKKIENIKVEEKLDEDQSKEIVVKLVEENNEIKNMLYKQFENMQQKMYEQQREMNKQINELIPRIGNNNTINKNKVNINIFLNEQCKDAITMEEFIKKIEVSMGDLLITGDKGISEGVSNIFIENMNRLSPFERPLHCTDIKREILYIKSKENQNTDSGAWERDDRNSKLKNALKQVTHMQQKSLEKWIKENPDWKNNNDLQEEYLRLVKNCTEDIDDKDNKIIKKLCSETLVNINDNDNSVSN